MLKTLNPEYGFHGTMHSRGWNEAMEALGKESSAPEAYVRAFLDSRDGRHFADSLSFFLPDMGVQAALDHTITAWNGLKPSPQDIGRARVPLAHQKDCSIVKARVWYAGHLWLTEAYQRVAEEVYELLADLRCDNKFKVLGWKQTNLDVVHIMDSNATAPKEAMRCSINLSEKSAEELNIVFGIDNRCMIYRATLKNDTEQNVIADHAITLAEWDDALKKITDSHTAIVEKHIEQTITKRRPANRP